MTEPLFFKRPSGLRLADVAKVAGATPQGDITVARTIADIATLDRAGPRDLTFLDDSCDIAQLTTTNAGACIMPERFVAHAPGHVAVLVAHEPYRAFVAVARALYADALRPSSLFEAAG